MFLLIAIKIFKQKADFVEILIQTDKNRQRKKKKKKKKKRQKTNKNNCQDNVFYCVVYLKINTSPSVDA